MTTTPSAGNPTEAALAEAGRLIQERDFDGAAAVLEPVVAANPRDAEAWQLLGTARYRSGDLQGAALAYEQRLKLAPNDSIGMYSLAIVRKDLGDETSARDLLVRITTLDPTFAPARARLGEWGPPSNGAGPNPTPSAAAGATAQTDIPRPSARGMVVGRARKVIIGSQPDPITIRGSLMVWTFRIERVDEAGNALSPVLVTMRGSRIDGQLADGDIVEAGPWRPGEMIRAKKATNLTTNSMIVTRGLPQWIFVAGLGLMILAFVLFAFWAYNKVNDSPGPPPPPVGQASPQTPTAGPQPGPGPQPEPEPNPQPQPAPVALTFLSVDPASVTSGTPSAGTVGLSDEAPSGGTAISLSSSDSGVAAVESSVTVPEGETSAGFDITTFASSENAVATISASAAGETQSAELTVNKSPDSDQLAVQRAEYRAATREVLLEATSSADDATLTAFATSTGEQIGVLESKGDGTFAGELAWPSHPEQVTIKSTSGGRKTIDVELT